MITEPKRPNRLADNGCAGVCRLDVVGLLSVYVPVDAVLSAAVPQLTSLE